MWYFSHKWWMVNDLRAVVEDLLGYLYEKCREVFCFYLLVLLISVYIDIIVIF